MTKETIHKATTLSIEIAELKSFRSILDRIRGFDKQNHIFLRIVRRISVGIGASFYFNVGRSTKVVDVPISLYEQIRKLAEKRQKELEQELEIL